MDRNSIVEALRNVLDPELGMDIVTLGLIYDITIAEDKVEITMTLTFPGCPLASMMMDDIQMKLEGVAGKGNTKINLVFEPRWNQSMMSEENYKKLMNDE